METSASSAYPIANDRLTSTPAIPVAIRTSIFAQKKIADEKSRDGGWRACDPSTFQPPAPVAGQLEGREGGRDWPATGDPAPLKVRRAASRHDTSPFRVCAECGQFARSLPSTCFAQAPPRALRWPMLAPSTDASCALGRGSTRV